MAESGCLRDVAVQNLDVAGDFNVAGTLRGGFSSTFANGARTALTASDANTLAVNTHNTLAATNTATALLPARAVSKKGDYITILLTGVIANGTTLKIGTATEALTIGSSVAAIGGVRVGAVDISASADAVLTITGATNGDGGIGTFIECYFNGTSWSMNAVVQSQGTGAAASTGTAFAAT